MARLRTHYYYSARQQSISGKSVTIVIDGEERKYTECSFDREDMPMLKEPIDTGHGLIPPTKPHNERFADSVYVGYRDA
jgi:hypothetical protein